MKATRKKPRGESYKEKATRRQLHQKAPKMMLLGESYQEKATRRKLKGEGHEETVIWRRPPVDSYKEKAAR